MDRVYAHVPTPRQDEQWTSIQRFVQEIYSRSHRSDGVRQALATIVEVTNPHWADLSAQKRSEIYALVANAHDAICDNPDLSAEDIRRILVCPVVSATKIPRACMLMPSLIERCIKPLGAKLVLLMSQELEVRVWVDKLPRSILDETVHRMIIEDRRDGSSSGGLRDALERARAEGLQDGWYYYDGPEKLEILEKLVALTERAEASLVLSLPDGAPRDTRPVSFDQLDRRSPFAFELYWLTTVRAATLHRRVRSSYAVAQPALERGRRLQARPEIYVLEKSCTDRCSPDLQVAPSIA